MSPEFLYAEDIVEIYRQQSEHNRRKCGASYCDDSPYGYLRLW